MIDKQGGKTYKHIEDGLVVSLVLNLKKSYLEVLDMDIEDAVVTYAIFYVDYLNLSGA